MSAHDLPAELESLANAAPQWSPGQSSRYEVIRYSEIEPRAVEWLVPGFIPLAEVSVVGGDPGVGKSTVLRDIAARLSRGRAMPGDAATRDAAGTVILSAEDDPESVIHPRLEAAGADLGRVATVRLCDADGTRREATLSAGDLVAVEHAVRAVGARLVIVDPLMAYLPQDVDGHRDQDVRRPLMALRALAARTGASVVVIAHLNKSAGSRALYRLGGSIGIVGAPRSVMILAADPDDPTHEALVLKLTKSNLAPTTRALRLRFEMEQGATFPRVQWEGYCQHSAESLLALPPSADDRSALDEAKDFLQAMLSPGPMRGTDVEREARAAGIHSRTLRRARHRLGIKPKKFGRPGGPEQGWLWSLPEGGHGDDPADANVANGAGVGQLREGSPLAAGCDDCSREDGREAKRGHLRETGAMEANTRGLGHLHDNGVAIPVSGADVVEDGHTHDRWAPSGIPWPPSGEPLGTSEATDA